MQEESKNQKRKNSNYARLDSIKRWKTQKALQTKQISQALKNLDSSSIKSKKIVFDSFSDTEENPVNTSNKLTLFEESDNEDDENYDEHFKIKRQYEGEKGKELFEKNLECSDSRFKLDERFLEEDGDDESKVDATMKGDEKLAEEDETEAEKEKNFAILEKVLGFEIPRKEKTDFAKTKKKKYIRFDPESENASDYIQKQSEEKSNHAKENKKHSKKEEELKSPTKLNPPAPIVSTERFFEVSTNLKELLEPTHADSTSSEQFSLGTKFQLLKGKETEERKEVFEGKILDASPLEVKDDCSEYMLKEEDSKKASEKNLNRRKNTNNVPSSQVKTRSFFFMQEDDHRLKDGVNFFHWSKSLDDVRGQWPSMRNVLIEAYKKNRKTKPSVPERQKSKKFVKRRQFYK